MPGPGEKTPQQAIVTFHRDAEGHWFARLTCGHNQHTRHDPPWINRPWVEHSLGRIAMIGQPLACRKCGAGAARDPNPYGVNHDSLSNQRGIS